MNKFSDPVLSPENRDMSKDWFVYIREYLPGGKYKLHVFKKGLNSKKVKEDKKLRNKLANHILAQLEERIKAGRIAPNENEPQQEYENLIDSLNEMIDIKRSALKKKTIQDYTFAVRTFSNWLKETGRKDIYPEKFTNKMAREYLDHLLKKRSYTGKSHNNVIGDFRNFFKFILIRDKERFKGIENPFLDITFLPEEEGKNFALTPEERQLIKDYLYPKKDPFFWACSFMYFCALRREDLANLKICDLDLINKSVKLHSASSKNRRQQSVTMPVELERLIKEMELEKYPDQYYMFSNKFLPGPVKMVRINNFSERFREIAKELKINPEKSFYSLKHSGLTDLFMKTKDPYIVQRQARHHDITTTMIYLRSLGLTVDERIRGVDFSF